MNLSEPYDENSFNNFIQGFFPDFNFDKRNVKSNQEVLESVTYLGESEKLRTSVFVIKTSLGINSRITLSKASFKILKDYSIYRALVVYLNEDKTIWRLSLLTAQPIIIDGKIVQSYSNPERFSYVLGSEVGVATARKYLLNMGQVSDFEDLRYRFSIEAINKEFYDDISRYFYRLTGTYDHEGKTLADGVLKLPDKPTHLETQEYAIRLFGRIIFCWFLREKKSDVGNPLVPSEIFDKAIERSKSALQDVLEPLFFECLNKPIENRNTKYTEGKYSLVPYLNGGLFHPNESSGGDYYNPQKSTSVVSIPNEWFEDVFTTLKTYNFTIDENLDFDVELSIDPEMLGRIFENLLAEINPETGESARKTTGSFYTPRRIVSHMTDMAIKQYLLDKTNVSEKQINALMTIDTLDDFEHPLNQAEKSQIVDALYGLKILDPACGSGAFPIGMLQKIIFMLEQVDSDSELTKKKLGKKFFAGREFLKENASYLRKLILIRDVIHGVDIQPVAVEISRLRCFLTLIVDQVVIDDAENRGIEPLPNLDFQFVSANSLVSLDKESQMIFGSNSNLEEELSEIRDEFYSTRSTTRRDALRTKYTKLIKDELTLFGESSRSTQLKSFQPFNPNSTATYFDPFNMFGIQTFDIVIGNPPYVKIEHLEKEIIATLQRKYFEERKTGLKPWADDLYVHFIFRAFELVKPNGVICFITNDSFIGLESKYRVREKLLSEDLVELISCPKETFGATIYTAIFLAVHRSNFYDHIKTSKFTYPGFELIDNQLVRKTYVADMPHKRLVFKEDELVAKLLSNTKVVDFLDVIDTGIHAGNVREKLFFKTQTDPKQKKLLQGRQIEKWTVWWDSPSAKYKYCNPNYVPRDEIGVGRGGKPSRLKEYWSYCRGGNEKFHYVPERILIRQTSDEIFAAYQNIEEDGQFYTDNTLFTVIPKNTETNLKYYLALLNSRIVNYIYKYLSMEAGKTLAQVKTSLVDQLPIVVDKNHVSEVVEQVDRIIAKRRAKHACDVQEDEKKLDALIGKIYGLTSDEMKLL